MFYYISEHHHKNFERAPHVWRLRAHFLKIGDLDFEIVGFPKFQISISGQLMCEFSCGRNILQPYARVIGHINQIGQIGLDAEKSTWKIRKNGNSVLVEISTRSWPTSKLFSKM